MPFTVTMPKLSPTMEEGIVSKWHKKEGDHVESGEVLLEIETDKATVEYEALDEGYLRKIVTQEGSEVKVNQPIGVFTEDKEESIEGYEPKGEIIEEEVEDVVEGIKEEEEKPKVVQSAPTGISQPSFVPEEPLEAYEFNYPAEEISERLKVSPLARKLAVDKKLDLSTVKGTGPGNRIMSRDLENAQRGGDFAFGHREKPRETPGTYHEEILTPMRKSIGKKLQEAKTYIPHFYVQQTIDAEPLFAFRQQLKNLELKVSFNDCVVRASALALRKHPNVNSGYNTVNNTIVRFKTIDVAIAVSISEGLITPIVRHADYKNLGEISLEIKQLAIRAKEKKLEQQEYRGGSFTVSNLGMYGVTDFQAIINPPQASILAVGGIQEVPVVKSGEVVPGKTMSLTLSSDHRVVDGVAAAEFLQTVKNYLENPVSLII